MLRSLHHHPPGLAMADIESILSQYSQTLPTHQIGHEKKCCATQGSAAPLKSDQSSIKGNNVKSPAPDAHLAEDKRTAEDDAEQCDVGTLGLIPPKTAVTQGRTHSPASPRCGRLDWCLKTGDNAITVRALAVGALRVGRQSAEPPIHRLLRALNLSLRSRMLQMQDRLLTLNPKTSQVRVPNQIH